MPLATSCKTDRQVCVAISSVAARRIRTTAQPTGERQVAHLARETEHRMESAATPVTSPSDAVRRQLIARYTQTHDATEQAQILAELEAPMPDSAEPHGQIPDAIDTAHRPDTDLATTPEYAQYTDLLPQVLAGVLPSESSAYQWFISFITAYPSCFREYRVLRAAIESDSSVDLSEI